MVTMIDVRAALPRDLPAAVEVWQAANTARGLPPTPPRLARIREKLTDPDATVLVATLPATPARAPATSAAAPDAVAAVPVTSADVPSAVAGVRVTSAGVPGAPVAVPASRPATSAGAPGVPVAVPAGLPATSAGVPVPSGGVPGVPSAAVPGVVAGGSEAVVGEGRVVVGMALVEPGRADDGAGELIPGYGHVSMVFVHPSHWSNGYGRHLLRAVHALGWTRTTLWTRESNSRAQRLYAAAGYTPTGRSARLHDGDAIIQLEHLAEPPSAG
ncbi:GNAT family N-acetyltransferase [Dactylosporangium sp. NPDC049525]|uniref:GNAT family N-acetyltransferase n=1 Tax=Dactylosporangium sp. NPDC049525 TaxID=3154730 RepID=UPI00344772A1